ncbi:MAG: ABC transporter substrate-binding protein, partial [Mesorhizobium sp.]|nr:ABC transporter substrate-binding protein [Mesorhizobium sp.]
MNITTFPAKKARAAAVAALLATSAFWAPSSFAQDSKPLIIARNIDLNSLDPHRAFCDTCQIYNSSVYESLLTLDKDNKLIPLLASKWESNADQTSFTFTLDPAAKFSDGSPVE